MSCILAIQNHDMKNILPLILLAGFSFVNLAFQQGDPKVLGLGEINPIMSVPLRTHEGKPITFKTETTENGLLVVFVSTSCGDLMGEATIDNYVKWLVKIKEFCSAKKIGLMYVNSNKEELEEGDAWLPLIAKSGPVNLMKSNYVLDESSEIRDVFGVKMNTEVFYFEGIGKLAYKGAFDDYSLQGESSGEDWLANAVSAVAKGVAPLTAKTEVESCPVR